MMTVLVWWAHSMRIRRRLRRHRTCHLDLSLTQLEDLVRARLHFGCLVGRLLVLLT